MLDRLVAGQTSMRVHPDDAMGQPVQPGHLVAEQGGVTALPAVTHHDDDRAPGHPALAPPVEERLQRLAQPGTAGPVRHRLPRDQERPVGVAENAGPW